MQAYIKLMDALQRLCLVVGAMALATITIIIPWGVFTRYVLNSASSWPEPLAVLLMILLSFISAVICYRDHQHIGVNMIPDKLDGTSKRLLGIAVELVVLSISLFMIWYGARLVHRTWFQSLAEFPSVPAGVSYLAVPIAGLITLLFGIERFLRGNYFPPPHDLSEVDTLSSE